MSAFEYGSRLVEPDGTPKIELQRILRAIGKFVAFGEAIGSVGRPCITPDRMYKWYQNLGAYTETLNFWTRSDKHICSVYTLLCIPHSLKQDDEEYGIKPSVPCLDLYGFEKWMMSRLLFDPEETAQFIMQCAVRGLFLGLDPPIDALLKRGILRAQFPQTPRQRIVEEYHALGFHNWKDMANRALVKKHLHRRKKQHTEKEKQKENWVDGGLIHRNVHVELWDMQPTVEAVVDSDGESDHISPTQNFYHTVEKTDFNYNARLPILNLNQNNCSNECIANSTRWISDSDEDSDTGSDYATYRGRSRCDSPPPSYDDIESVNSGRLPTKAFGMLSIERSTPFSAPSSSRSPVMRAIDCSGYGSDRITSTDTTRYSVMTDATQFSQRSNAMRASKVSDNSGWSMRVNALSHSGYGNDDSDSDSRKSPISSNWIE